jgi:curli production assembly/transport component CsgF
MGLRHYKTKQAIAAYIVLAMGLVLFSEMAVGQQVVFAPVNPTLGGNPSNGDHLSNVAGAQNDYSGPVKTAAENLERQIETRTISILASQIIAKQFPREAKSSDLPQEPVIIGDLTLVYTPANDGSTILSITDGRTGGVTEIVIPAPR